MSAVRDDVAAMLRAGATYAEIIERLGVSSHTIVRTRRDLGIALPPGRAKRTTAQVAALEDHAVVMLRRGLTQLEIYKALRLSLNTISALRRQHNIPIPRREHPSLSVDEAFARHTAPSTQSEHLVWTGPRSGRGVDLLAGGRRYNARAIAFRKHHHRDPVGQIRRTCDVPECIAGAHHTDRRIRQADARADQAYNAIFGRNP
ncbi:MAG: hypothetical protein HOZ81_28005 [Streptomyces sp.]|nr:hypothetical protein [Streptomyces sp.]